MHSSSTYFYYDISALNCFEFDTRQKKLRWMSHVFSLTCEQKLKVYTVSVDLRQEVDMVTRLCRVAYMKLQIWHILKISWSKSLSEKKGTFHLVTFM